MKLLCTTAILFLALQGASAQVAAADSSYCFVLNEAIRAASTDWIPEYFGEWREGTRNLKPVKTLRNLPGYSGKDSIEVIEQKLVYHAQIVAIPSDTLMAKNVWNHVSNQLLTCLASWRKDELTSSVIPALPDLLLTNPEDDTSVRVSVSRTKSELIFKLTIF